MSEPLYVLLIEDSEDDALLILRELRRGNFELVWERVQTADTLQAMLDGQPWDIIISDYRLPGFDAPAALRMVQQHQRDLPFIVVSGTIGEQLAVELMKAGAHDYLMKGNLTRLPEAVRREVRDAKIRAERKRSEEILQKTERQFREAQRIAQLGSWEMDLVHHVLHWSEEVFRIFELNPEQFHPSYETFLRAVHPGDRQRVSDAYQQHLRDRTPYHLVHRLQLPDGRIKYVREQCETLYGEDGQPLLSQGTVQDITQQQAAEQERERAEEALRQVLQGTSAVTGKHFFPKLVQQIAQALGVRHAVVSQTTPNGFTLLAVYSDGLLQPSEHLPFAIAPCCVQAMEQGEYCQATGLQSRYPDNPIFQSLQADSYLGIGLHNADGKPIGNLCVLHDRPLENLDWARTLLRTFAVRAAAEIERYQTAQALERLTVELENRVAERTAALQDREAQLRDFFDNANDLIQSIGLEDGHFEYVNRAWRETLGYGVTEVATLTIFDVLHPACQERFRAVMAQAQAGTLSALERIELTFLTRQQQAILVDGSLNCRFEQNRPVAMRAIFRNITERKQAEADRDRLLNFLDASLNEIYVFEAGSLRFVYANQGAIRNLGYSLETLKTMTPYDLKPDFTATQFRQLLQPLLTGKQTTLHFETRHQRADGSFYPVEIYLQQHEHLGAPFFLAVILDVSERHLAEQALQTSETRLQLITDSVHGCISYVDASKRYRFINRTYEVWFGCRKADIIGRTLEDVIGVEAYCRTQQYVERALAGETVTYEARLPYQGGCSRYVSAVLVPDRDAEGQVHGYYALITDISDRKQAEAELQQTNEELARATRLKDEFLANMSHELRTPLNAILGMTEGLMDQVFGPVQREQLKALETIDRSGSHLLELINDILDVAKIESGQIALEPSITSVPLLCQSSVAFIKQQAQKKNLKVTVNLPLHLPDLWVDERRIRQVLINLLNNAVKFTSEGGRITLDVSYHPSKTHLEEPSDKASSLRIAVSDTGIGIAPEHIHKLFQPFIQIDSALNRQYTGTGLGLALVKRIVELHGGQVGLTSEVGVGSCFTVDLPCATIPALDPAPILPDMAGIAPDQPQPHGSPLILLAEDNAANIGTLSSYLTAKGYRLLLAQNGQEAIALAQSQHPDLILMDIQMPGMDGLEAIRHIRNTTSLTQTPIIALTALAMAGDRDRCLATGANDYLAKPVKLKQLAATIDHLLTSTPQEHKN